MVLCAQAGERVIATECDVILLLLLVRFEQKCETRFLSECVALPAIGWHMHSTNSQTRLRFSITDHWLIVSSCAPITSLPFCRFIALIHYYVDRIPYHHKIINEKQCNWLLSSSLPHSPLIRSFVHFLLDFRCVRNCTRGYRCCL